MRFSAAAPCRVAGRSAAKPSRADGILHLTFYGFTGGVDEVFQRPRGVGQEQAFSGQFSKVSETCQGIGAWCGRFSWVAFRSKMVVREPQKPQELKPQTLKALGQLVFLPFAALRSSASFSGSMLPSSKPAICDPIISAASCKCSSAALV